MSFILDALRKAEDGRQSAPLPSVPITPAAVPTAPPNTRRRTLGIALALLLSAGATAAWFLTRPADQPPAPRTVELSQPAPTSAIDTAPAAQPAPTVQTRRTPVRALDQEASLGAPPPANRPAPARVDSSRSASTRSAPVLTPGTVTVMEPQDIAALEAGIDDNAQAAGDTDAYANLPDYDNMLRNGRVSMTNLSLDMHVFNADPAKRFVFINMRKYREGDRVDNQATVEQITDYGAILDNDGQLFVLRPQ